MTNTFRITVNTINGDIVIDNLTEREARNIMMNAYECINHLDEVVVFTNDVKVSALDFVSFYVS